MATNLKHVLSINDFTKEDIEYVLQTASSLSSIIERDIKKVPTLRGKSVVNIFFEPSTRTRTSFEIAAKMMSADLINISASASSIQKGESLKDTILTLQALGANIVVIRHPSSGVPQILSKLVKSSIINAGDGAHQHPTQALTDLYTVKAHKKEIGGLKIAIVGDILHSRVARSNMQAFLKMGAEVFLIAPPTLIPPEIESFGAKVSYSIFDVIEKIDIIYVLRIQLERQTSAFFPSIREYHQLYGISKDVLKKAKQDVLIMHPGPMNRGVEIDSEVADSMSSLIEEQVKNGVIVRMALLYLLSQLS